MAIVLQFSLSAGFGSWMIEWFDRGLPFSHVDVVLDDGRLLGAQRKKVGGFAAGVQIRSPDYEPFKRRQRIKLVCAKEVSDRFYELVKGDIGRAFDTLGEVDFLFAKGWHTRNARFCAEEVVERLLPQPRGCGYFPFELALPPNKITPGDLLLILSSQVSVRLS